MIRNIGNIILGLFLFTLHGHMLLIGLVLYVLSNTVVNLANTAMTRSLVQRVDSLVSGSGTTNTRINNLSGQATGTGLPAGTPTSGVNGGGSGSLEVGPADNGGTTSGPSGTVSSFPAAGPNHTHAMSHQHVYDHTHDFDGHTHDLPVV